jgi:tetratricopeptide (TPR) repeat protein
MSNHQQAAGRLQALKNMVAQNPADSFSRYGLAMEYRNGGDLEAAMEEFRALMAANPDYVAAYFHGGQTLERLGLVAEARNVYQRGAEAAARTGNRHAQSEIEAALAMLG